jgi:hypothetical protein
MVFEEFNIHPEKESDRKLVDCFYHNWKIRRFYGDFESGI